MITMDEEPLVFEWPSTSRLEIHPAGKRAVTLRFAPSDATILGGLRKATVEPRYSDFPTGYPTTPRREKGSVLRHFWHFWYGLYLDGRHDEAEEILGNFVEGAKK